MRCSRAIVKAYVQKRHAFLIILFPKRHTAITAGRQNHAQNTPKNAEKQPPITQITHIQRTPPEGSGSLFICGIFPLVAFVAFSAAPNSELRTLPPASMIGPQFDSAAHQILLC